MPLRYNKGIDPPFANPNMRFFMLNNDQDRLKKLMDASISAFETLLKYKSRLVPSEFSDEAEKVLGDSIYRFKKVKENLLKSDLSSEALEQNGLNAPQLTIKLKAIELLQQTFGKSFREGRFPQTDPSCEDSPGQFREGSSGRRFCGRYIGPAPPPEPGIQGPQIGQEVNQG